MQVAQWYLIFQEKNMPLASNSEWCAKLGMQNYKIKWTRAYRNVRKIRSFTKIFFLKRSKNHGG